MSQPKPGDRFSFSFLDEEGARSHRAVVESILSNREEGLSPEIDEYVADWLEALPLDPLPGSEAPLKSFTVMLGTNNKTYIQGRPVTVTFELWTLKRLLLNSMPVLHRPVETAQLSGRYAYARCPSP